MNQPITPIPASAAVPLAELHRACFPEDPWEAPVLERILTLAGTFGYLAWHGETPSGFILARNLGREVEVLSLGVLPRWRRRGIGRGLIDAVVGEATRCGVGSIVLEVASENEPARRLYAAFGFIQVGRRPRYYRQSGTGADGLILRRAIAGEGSGGGPEFNDERQK
jgi:[ribosomal protein S18]-alanine N-acetyltransferase